MLTYFVQVNVCWLLFYGAYYALLSRETFFRLNRIWLIISLLAGLILPFIAPALTVVEPTNVAMIMLEPIVISASDLGQNLQNTEGVVFKILAAIYGLGVVVSLGKLLIGFWKIKRLLNRADALPMDDFTLMQVSEAIAPFSFFRWIFINLNLVESADLQQIILHERAHVQEKHSFDVVFSALLSVVFWWSPLIYFYTKSLKNVHEYAADAVVLRTSSPPQYGRLLLRQQQSGMSLSLVNPFFSQLKKRILMMTRNPSKRRALVKYALAVPIFLVLTLLLASPKTQLMAITEAATDKVVASIETFEKNVNTPQDADNEAVTSINLTDKTENIAFISGDSFIVKATSPQYVAVKDSSDPIYTVVEENPQFVYGIDSMFRFLGRNMKYPVKARESGMEGTTYIGFVVEKNGELTNIVVRRSVAKMPSDTTKKVIVDGKMEESEIEKEYAKSFAEEAVRVISMMPKWKPGKSNGVPVRVAYTLPIKFKLE